MFIIGMSGFSSVGGLSEEVVDFLFIASSLVWGPALAGMFSWARARFDAR